MMKTFVQPGDVISTAALANVAAGGGVLVGSLFGVATQAATTGQLVPIVVEGVVEIAKDPALVINLGDRVFWDPTNLHVDKTATAQTCVGVALQTVLAAAPTIRIKLGSVPPAGA